MIFESKQSSLFEMRRRFFAGKTGVHRGYRRRDILGKNPVYILIVSGDVKVYLRLRYAIRLYEVVRIYIFSYSLRPFSHVEEGI